MDVIWASLRAGAEKIIDRCITNRQSGTFRGLVEDEVDGASRLWVSSLDSKGTRIKQRLKIELSKERLGQGLDGALQAGLFVATADDMRFGTGNFEL